MITDLIVRVSVRTTTTTTRKSIIRVRGVCELREARAMYGWAAVCAVCGRGVSMIALKGSII